MPSTCAVDMNPDERHALQQIAFESTKCGRQIVETMQVDHRRRLHYADRHGDCCLSDEMSLA